MFAVRILSVRCVAILVACGIGTSAALAADTAVAGGECSPACSMVDPSEEECPAGTHFATVFCADQNDNQDCTSAGYCVMGLCYDGGGAYYLIGCTDDPGPPVGG